MQFNEKKSVNQLNECNISLLIIYSTNGAEEKEKMPELKNVIKNATEFTEFFPSKRSNERFSNGAPLINQLNGSKFQRGNLIYFNRIWKLYRGPEMAPPHYVC